MKRFLGMGLFILIAAVAARAQVTDTTVCAVLKNPKAFDGKMVRIKGTVVSSYDQFVVDDGDCGKDVNSIWLAYPQGSKVKSGPVAMVELEPAHNFAGKVAEETRTPVTLTRDKQFKQFDSLLSQSHQKDGSLCVGCSKYQVQATLVGRLDGIDDPSITRNAAGKIVGLGGFGNLNAYAARLVLQSVADVTPKPIDYSKSDQIIAKSAAGGNPPQTQPAPYVDPVDMAHTILSRLAPGPTTTQIQKDLALLPVKGKELDGVSIEYGQMNEVPQGPAPAGTQDSSDGVLYICSFNRDRLQPNPTLSMALLHAAQHVADVREPIPGNENAPLYYKESNAWAVTATVGLGAGEKFVVLPGGYIMWDASWTADNRLDNMSSALNDFLTKEELLSK